MKQNILIVDDEVSIQESLSGILQDEGYDVAVATDGNGALKTLEGDAFNLVFLDIVMPGIDGIETLRRIKIIQFWNILIIL